LTIKALIVALQLSCEETVEHTRLSSHGSQKPRCLFILDQQYEPPSGYSVDRFAEFIAPDQHENGSSAPGIVDCWEYAGDFKSALKRQKKKLTWQG